MMRVPYHTLVDGGITWTIMAGHKLIDTVLFLPVPTGNSSKWQQGNYLFCPSSGKCYSTATGHFKELLGTAGFQDHTLLKDHQIFSFNRSTFTRGEIFKAYKRYTSTHAVKNSNAIEPKGQNVIADHHAQKSRHLGQADVKKGNVIIGKVITLSDGTETIEIAKQPKIHEALVSVTTELERLAKTYPGEKFIALHLGASVVLGGLSWS